MMFFFKKFKTVNTNDECLNKILSIFLEYENEIQNGKYNLCLTVEFLMFFDDLNRNLKNELCDQNFKDKYQSKIEKLNCSFKNLNLLKITGNLKESFKLKFDLKYFTNLKSLELENVYLDNILNLNEIIHQIITLKLNRCLSNKSFEDIFNKDLFTSLINLSISRTVFKDDVFNFVPITTFNLQLQWNQIKQFKINCSARKNLTELDLSFNKLKEIPYFDEKELICNTLKVLKLRGNLIDSLKNIENLNQLEQLDISVNLICNKDDLNRYLSFCKRLKILNLIDNPIQMKENLNLFILELFPSLRKFNNQLCYNDKSTDKQLNNSIQNDLFNDFDDKNSIISTKDNSICSSVKASKIKDRIAVILDPDDSFTNELEFDQAQSDQDRLSSLSCSTKGLSLGLDNNLADLKEIIANQRKSLNEKLLNKPKSTNLTVPFSTPVDCSNIADEIEKIKDKKNSKSLNFDLQIEEVKAKIEDLATVEQNLTNAITEERPENIKLTEENDNNFLTNLDNNKLNYSDNVDDFNGKENFNNSNEMKKHESMNSLSPKEEDNLWANEDMESDNIFLVNKLDSNSIEIQEPIFILIKDSLIYEKDCANGKIFEVYDLNVITNYELDNSTTITLNFDSKVKSKQKVTYNLELDSQLKKFLEQFIEPFIEKYKKDKFNQRFKYECLKCGSKNSEQLECSICKSTALIESTNNNLNNQCNKKIQPSFADKPNYLTQNSFKEEFLNQVKLKLTNEIVNDDKSIDNENNEETELNYNNQLNTNEEDNEEEIKEIIKSKLENYELDQFTSIDHELKLYLDVKIFINTEHLEHLFECDFTINDTSEINRGKIVITNTSLHLVSYKLENCNQIVTADCNEDNDRPFNIFTMPLNKIKNIKLSRDYFFHQCVWLTVDRLSGKKKKKKHLVDTQTFFIILKDKKLVDLFCDYLENYLNKQEIKLKININSNNLTERSINLDTEENIIFSQFIVSLTTKSDLEISKSSTDDLLCLLFDKSAEIILTRCEVIANELKFKKICRNDLSNLICAKLDENNCMQLHLYFSNQFNEKIEWIIGSYSANSLSKIIDLIKTLYETLYKIPLQFFLKNK